MELPLVPSEGVASSLFVQIQLPPGEVLDASSSFVKGKPCYELGETTKSDYCSDQQYE